MGEHVENHGRMRLKNAFSKNGIEVGCDEAGRGCLAGPVYAAAVILPSKKKHALLNDSKQVSSKNRLLLRDWIISNATEWAVGVADAEEIDQINILNASFLAMHRAIDQLKTNYDLLLIDGNRFNPYKNIQHHCIIKGDEKYKTIAAASILAKTFRDEYMKKLDLEHPEYNWKSNKGYGSLSHRIAIKNNGYSPYHRKSFQLKSKI